MAVVVSVPLSAATIAISVLWFRHLDLTFDYFIQLIVVPICQAIALAVASSPSHRARRGAASARLRHTRLVIPVLVMDAGLFVRMADRIACRLGYRQGATSLHVSWIATKAVAAALFLLVAAARAYRASPLPYRWSIGDRLYLAGFASLPARPRYRCVLAVALARPGSCTQGRAVVLQWLASYGVLFLVWMALALKAADILRRQSPIGAFYVEAAAAMAFGCAVLLVLNAFERRFVPDPWLSVIRTAASVGASFRLDRRDHPRGKRHRSGKAGVRAITLRRSRFVTFLRTRGHAARTLAVQPRALPPSPGPAASPIPNRASHSAAQP